MQVRTIRMEEIAMFGALFAALPRTYAKYSPRQARLRLHPNLTSPPMRTVHSPPELHQCCQFRGVEDLTGYWIGSPARCTRREGRL